MLNEPHYPSKWSVAVVFIIILLLIGGVFAWAFYFNFGTVKLSGNRNFVVSVNGQEYSCVPNCEIFLPPAEYEFVAKSEGYYDQTFSLDVLRWDTHLRDLTFLLVPFLKTVSELPSESEENIYFKSDSGKKSLYMKSADGEKLVTAFESLKDPRIHHSGNLIVVLDSGRVFFVDVDTGRKTRRFDESVFVNDVLISDGGRRVLLFVTMKDQEFIWDWNNENNQLTTLTWYEPIEKIEWDLDVDHRIFVLTDKLFDPTQSTIIEKLTDDESKKTTGIFLYNLDSAEVRQISLFEEKSPEQLIRRGDQFFVEYEGGVFEELVVK